MAKVKFPQIPEKIDRLGALQEQYDEAQNAFAEKYAEVTQEILDLKAELEAVVAARLPLVRQQTLTKEEAESLTNALTTLLQMSDLEGTYFKLPVSIRNNKILDQETVRKTLGQKRFNSLAQVSVTDLGKVLGKEDIDGAITGYKPTLIVGKTARK